jgi:hypothetical protein
MFLKFVTAFILVIILAYTTFLFSSIVPWWGFALGAFIVGLVVPQKAWLSWLSAFLALFICWGLLTFNISSANNHLLASKMATVLPAAGSKFLLIIITALLAALIAGFASLAGTYLRKK